MAKKLPTPSFLNEVLADPKVQREFAEIQAIGSTSPAVQMAQTMAANRGSAKQSWVNRKDLVFQAPNLGGKAPGGGGGLKSGFWDIGSNVLKSFSVPQSLVVVPVANLWAASGRLGGGSKEKFKHTDWDLAWKGAYADRYKGWSHATRHLVEADLLPDKSEGGAAGQLWRKGLNLTLDVVVDPLLLVGAVSKPFQGAAAVEKAAKVAKASEEIERVGKGVAAAVRAGKTDADKAQKALVGLAGEAAPKALRAANEAQMAEVAEKAQGFQVGLRLGLGMKQVRAGDIHPALSPEDADAIINVPRGIFIPLMPKTKGKDPKVILDKLADGKLRTSTSRRILQKFRTVGEDMMNAFDDTAADYARQMGIDEDTAKALGILLDARAGSGGKAMGERLLQELDQINRANGVKIDLDVLRKVIDDSQEMWDAMAKANGMKPWSQQRLEFAEIAARELDKWGAVAAERVDRKITALEDVGAGQPLSRLRQRINRGVARVQDAAVREDRAYREMVDALDSTQERVNTLERQIEKLGPEAKGARSARLKEEVAVLKEEVARMREETSAIAVRPVLEEQHRQLVGLRQELRSLLAKHGAEGRPEAAFDIKAVHKEIAATEDMLRTVDELEALQRKSRAVQEAYQAARNADATNMPKAKAAMRKAENQLKSLRKQRTELMVKHQKAWDKSEQARLELADQLKRVMEIVTGKQAGDDLEEMLKWWAAEGPKQIADLTAQAKQLDALKFGSGEELLNRLQTDGVRMMDAIEAQIPLQAREALETKIRQEATWRGLSEFGDVPHRQYYVWDEAAEAFVFNPDAAQDAAKFHQTLDDMFAKVQHLEAQDDYYPLILAAEVKEEASRYVTDQVAKGYVMPDIDVSAAKTTLDMKKGRKVERGLNTITEGQLVEYLVGKEGGGWNSEAAKAFAKAVSNEIEMATDPKVLDGFADAGINYFPEFDWRLAASARNRAGIERMIQDETVALWREAGMLDLDDPARVAETMTRMWRDINKGRRHVPIVRTPAWFEARLRKMDPQAHNTNDAIQYGTAWLKAWYTVMNTGHYVANMAGQVINNMLTPGVGPMQALRSAKGAIPSPFRMNGFDYRTAANFGRQVRNNQMTARPMIAELEKMKVTVGKGAAKREIDGVEAAFIARMSGMGHGYIQSEVDEFLQLLGNKGRNPMTRIRNFASRFNMDRENGMRFASLVGHLRNGDDVLTAGAKVVRTHFDYNDLTLFEKTWVRNLLFFYTWFKKNLELQGKSVFMRPGAYSVMETIERQRPKFDNEPYYFRHMGGVTTPIGLVTIANPMSELYRWADLSDNGKGRNIHGMFRSNIVGMFNPFIKVPLELAFQRDAFTGAEISKFEGQQVPHWMGYMLNPIGIGDRSRAFADDESRSPAIPASLAHTFEAFMGPQGGAIQAASDDDKAGGWWKFFGSFAGPRVQPKDEPRWETMLEYAKTREKSEKTRKRNYEAP